MVLPGQYLERSVVVGDLDALYHGESALRPARSRRRIRPWAAA